MVTETAHAVTAAFKFLNTIIPALRSYVYMYVYIYVYVLRAEAEFDIVGLGIALGLTSCTRAAVNYIV